MRSIFEDRQVSIKCDDKYSYTVTKDGLAYVPGNGKSEVKVLFSEVGSTFLLNYCSSNGPYEITFKDNEGHNLVSIDTDLKLREFGHNILDTKTIILAFAANKLTTEFPNNLDTLNTKLGFSLKEKKITIANGVISGAKHQIKLSDIRRVQCVAGGALNNLFVFTKEKGGFFDRADIVVPVNELTVPILEAAMRRNTGHGIDFSRGNGFDQPNSNFIIIRYLDSSFFETAPGVFKEDWQKDAYEFVKSFGYDLQTMLGE